jgi:hypothetical protein
LRATLFARATNGTVGFVVDAWELGACQHENSPPSPGSGATISRCRLPLPTEAITLAVGWYLRVGVASRDLEEPLTKCDLEEPLTKCDLEEPLTECDLEEPLTKCEVEVEDRTSSRRCSGSCRYRPTLPMAPPHGDRWPVTSPR